MHRVLSARSQMQVRKVNDRGEIVTTNIEDELNKLPFSARTTKRSLTKLDMNKVESTTNDIDARRMPFSARPTKLTSDKSRPSSNLTKRNNIPTPNSSRAPSTISIDQDSDILQLMKEGNRCCSANQKNDIIIKLGNYLIDARKELAHTKEELTKLQQTINAQQNEIDSQKQITLNATMTTDRISKLRHLASVKSNEDLINEIKKIEEDSKKYLHLSEPWLLQEVCNKSEDEQFQCLINLKFRRLEDLIYGLRRQLLNDQDVIALFPLINQKFGSVRNLLSKYNEAIDSIQRYKVREFRLSESELMKRRPLSEMDNQALYTLIIALQNELGETKQFARDLMRSTTGSRAPENFVELSENPNYDEISSKLNNLEGLYGKLQERCASLEKDNEFLKSTVNLESDVLKEGIFKINEKMGAKITDCIDRMTNYQREISKLQNTIEMQQQLIAQFQKEKEVTLRKMVNATSIVNGMKIKMDQSELKAKNAERKLKGVRAIARTVMEIAMPMKTEFDKSFGTLEDSYIAKYMQQDAAALIIQNAWRRRKNSRAEKAFLKESWHDKSVKLSLPMFAIDTLIGTLPPIKYRQVVALLHSYQTNVVENAQAVIDLSVGQFKKIRARAEDACERVLCKPRHFMWTQTENNRADMEVQTDRIIPQRTKK
ncbi:hypothetical protein TVAG_433190 [Trichomonas vaginalis G3]|uniref:Uncharacterized protein n=1 Tax=Trichomonas vaginalis (strain ATCC PRA-98 / G3) TaxID=412133 RepID=A2DIW0_TRIV3|nr:hypothetical protein TVAGG3_0561900 [Trichomonas vaginalis G3]EAY19723.1 hypothetical protein TVAG_433190 [Trichomonas vaginalis G3]KAI5521257.1 hypothetical protein TVAGG3_0561900 [Trichomonas vaginalis G3]|eukprot:XP_001580709.1 hypothetical protein [Trichomonas vaginalis G3]